MRKLARIVTGVFEARHSHVGAKMCYGSKISKGGFIKVTICLTEPSVGSKVGVGVVIHMSKTREKRINISSIEQRQQTKTPNKP
jgi:hypothetical protein